MIRLSHRAGKKRKRVADKYIAAFREDVTALSVATRHPRVVEVMADIIRL